MCSGGIDKGTEKSAGLPRATQLPTDGGSHELKGRLRCHKRPKSREETPKKGSGSGMGMGVRYRITLPKTILISALIAHGSSIERCQGTMPRFMALVPKVDHFPIGHWTLARPSATSALPLDAVIP